MPVSYRRAGSDDAARLALIAAATFVLACPPHTTAGGIQSHLEKTLTRERFDEYLADGDRMLFLAESEGLPIGYTMVILGPPADPDVQAVLSIHPTAELSKCYVVPGFHGQGVAAELMRLSVEAAGEGGASGVWLGVNNLNVRANRFYEKSGFTVVGTKTFYVGTEREDDFVRERAL
ncbi:GNAT family N-acetyltransferase [Subtercola boreus]|uniref:GNAT family N-acetyltransferase n=1 Tax=Subtercola boreus TaxID=120213 RepID=A0A3E0W7W3_9MICO|nr:GNAT family N-acetyltransferase [Subtercola boreus]RFA18773.1 GNAT family N-acetyltransferase [Subtercola boreus]RFA18890.1 GNAT family N-acetyltransferase [Subtercola boreus]RFA25425.1 GNAT family N-acetyltransferase [Subtercola boreus]